VILITEIFLDFYESAMKGHLYIEKIGAIVRSSAELVDPSTAAFAKRFETTSW